MVVVEALQLPLSVSFRVDRLRWIRGFVDVQLVVRLLVAVVELYNLFVETLG